MIARGFTLHWTIVALMNLKQITGRINQQLWLLILSTNCSICHKSFEEDKAHTDGVDPYRDFVPPK
ncbi:MAG: hypothetical protein ACI9EW_000311 [Cellvibrionaceae bacterium]